MTDSLRIYLNERAADLPAGATVRDAISRLLPELLADCEAGTASLTDGRGLALPLDAVLAGGAILRAARSSRRAAIPDAGT